MMEFDLVITNGTCVTATDVGRYDIGIKDEKIALLAPSGFLANVNATRVIDAEGGYVTVRLHFHLHECDIYSSS